MAQLDALRAVAVTAVIIHHYRPGGWGYGAYSGVRLFFTISGFLITGILIRSRDNAEANKLTRLSALGRFYARRFLRIFPLYYFVVAVAFAIDLDPARKLIASLLTYTLNIHMARQGWYEANFAHFWSLSVEEQFYISWPWLVVFLPRKWLMPAVLTMVSIGPLYRLSYILSGYQNMTDLSTYISTLTSVDNLGMGALLAILHHRGPIEKLVKYRVSWILLPFALLATAALVLWGGNLRLVLHDPLQAIAFCCLIFFASRGIGGPVGRFLEWRPVSYMGKISYALYVYHPLMPLLGSFILLKTVHITLPEKSLPVSAFATVLSFAVASLSWHLMEKPINDLKRYF